jgi:hypothetical protein
MVTLAPAAKEPKKDPLIVMLVPMYPEAGATEVIRPVKFEEGS